MKQTTFPFTSRGNIYHYIAIMTMSLFTLGLTACGSDDDDDDYEKLGVSVSPKSLEYGAEGGTKSAYINYGSYSYYGASVRTEGHGWVSVSTPGGPAGEIKIAVEPNTTGKERECYVDCYVMPNESSTESDKIKMPVHIKQSAKAGGSEEGGGESTIKSVDVKYFHFAGEFQVKPTWSYNGSNHPQETTTKLCAVSSEVGYGEDPNSLRWTATLNGTTLHITAQQSYAHEYGSQYKYTSSLSFDITGFTGNFKNTRLENVVYLMKNEYSAYEGSEFELRLTDVPFEYVYEPNKLINAYQLRLSGTRADGVDVSTIYFKDWWKFADGTSVTAKYNFLNDKSDKASLDIQFLPSSASSAPRRSANTITIPIEDITPAAPRATQVEASVK